MFGCRRLLGDGVAAVEAAVEVYQPILIDLVPSVVLAVAGIALTGSGAVGSYIPPIGIDARSGRCEAA